MEALKTNNGNYLVAADQLFAFFSVDGKFLREATEREFKWAQNKMKSIDSEINFDFDSLKRIIVERKDKAFSELISFISLSREVVQSILDYFKGSPEELKINGFMSSDWKISSTSTGGCMYSHEEWNSAWGIFLDGNIVQINGITLEENSEQNANGSWSDARGYTAEYLLKTAPGAEFFIVNSGHNYHTDGDYRDDKEDIWEIFQKPDLSLILEARRENTLRKAKNFLFCIKTISEQNFELLFDLIIKTLAIESPENIIFGEIGPEWLIAAMSTGGCMFSDRQWNSVYAVTPDLCIIKIDNVLIEEDDDSYGYNFKYLKKVAKQSLFFVVNEGREYRVEKGCGDVYNNWSFLRPLSRKEIMIKKIV